MNKRRIGNYQVEDFLADGSFINYCLHQNREDTRFWDEWLIANPEKRPIAEQAMGIISMLSLNLPEQEYREELLRMSMAVKPAVVPSVTQPSILRFLNWNKSSAINRSGKRRLTRYLVPALIVFLITGYLLLKGSGMIEKYNQGSLPLTFTLGDNTVVTLASHSRLRYPGAFGSKERKVYLFGEASFQVSADGIHPFKVCEDDLVATVLGTEFSIRKEHNDSLMLVELLKGRLKVETTGSSGSVIQSILLDPHERVVYNRYDKHIFKEAWLAEGSVSVNNRLVFRQNNFEEIAARIKSVFGITLVNRSNKKNWRFTGEFTNSTAKEIIENICQVEGLNSESGKDTIFIK